MELEKLIEYFEKQSKEFGFNFKTEARKQQNAVWRKNIPESDLDFKKGAYFGIIRENEEPTGAYSDFSLVIFPNRMDDGACTHFIIALAVGSLGFNKDYTVSTLPWLRRLFSRLRDKKYSGEQFFKADFSDIENRSVVAKYISDSNEVNDLTGVIKKYGNFISACQIVKINKNEDQKSSNFSENDVYEIVNSWLATYALFREVSSNKKQRTKLNNSLPSRDNTEYYTSKDIYEHLLKNRFIVLQGAPGTGKTWLSNEISDEYFSREKGKTFFVQFHAETSYSDFVYGIKPKTKGESLLYENHEGILLEAIKSAQETKKPTLLIIDEINRANLANVLGPVFYLFEKDASNRKTTIKIGEEEIKELPEKLYVLATMNTADRSLAVVDFALRRRFSWINIKPHEIDNNQLANENEFMKEEFKFFAELFDKYASSEELNLQPGQSYFIVKNKDCWNNRLKYELIPLMKEYFNEGYLRRAVSEFSDYVYNKLGIDLYE